MRGGMLDRREGDWCQEGVKLARREAGGKEERLRWGERWIEVGREG